MKKWSQNIALSILLGNLFLAFLGISLVIPVMPTLMNELGISGTTVGYLVAAFAIVQMVTSPIGGKWVDQYGRKPILIIGLIIFAFSELLFGVGKTVSALFAARALGGLSAAFIMPAVTAFIADITTVKTRSKALGYMSAAINTGFIIGPGIGGFLAEISIRTPFYVAAVMGVIAAILSFIFLKEPERIATKKEKSAEKIGFKKGIQKVANPAYMFAYLVIFISMFGLASFESLFSLFVDHKFSFMPKDIAIAVIGGGLFGAVAQLFLFDRMANKFGEISIIRYSLMFSAILTYLMTVVQTYATIMLVTWTVFIGFDLIRPAATSYLSKIAGDEQGFVGGMNSMFTSLGNVMGPIVGGMLFDINLNYPFYFSTLVILICVVIATFWRNKESPSRRLQKKFN